MGIKGGGLNTLGERALSLLANKFKAEHINKVGRWRPWAMVVNMGTKIKYEAWRSSSNKNYCLNLSVNFEELGLNISHMSSMLTTFVEKMHYNTRDYVDDVANNNLSAKISYSKKSICKHNETISNDNTEIIKNSIDSSNENIIREFKNAIQNLFQDLKLILFDDFKRIIVDTVKTVINHQFELFQDSLSEVKGSLERHKSTLDKSMLTLEDKVKIM